jgi:hypothetical protein
MRLGILGGLALGLLLSGSALANTINFGGMTNNSSCSVAGDGGDRSCTNTGSVNNGANDNTASLNIRGQASADHGITTNPTAIADMTISYDIPYTVTRSFQIPQATFPLQPLIAQVPTQQILFDMTWLGDVAKDNSQATGGLGQATAFTASIQSLGGRFTTTTYLGGAVTGGGGVTSVDVNRTTVDPTYATTPNLSGPSAGEIAFVFQIPTDYRMWTDNVVPQAFIYAQGPYTVNQSFTDTLRVTFRLRAESRPSGSISVTGGEAIACFGQTSPLGGFVLDNNAAVNCGSGMTVNASTTVTGFSAIQVAIPEPATLGLLGGALAGVVWAGTRKRNQD